jgi:hypothetical protein
MRTGTDGQDGLSHSGRGVVLSSGRPEIAIFTTDVITAIVAGCG